MYLSHFMYHGLVTTLRTLYFFVIYIYIYIHTHSYIYIYIYDDDDDDVCFFTFILNVLFLFPFYTHVSSFLKLVYVSHLMP